MGPTYFGPKLLVQRIIHPSHKNVGPTDRSHIFVRGIAYTIVRKFLYILGIKRIFTWFGVLQDHKIQQASCSIAYQVIEVISTKLGSKFAQIKPYNPVTFSIQSRDDGIKIYICLATLKQCRLLYGNFKDHQPFPTMVNSTLDMEVSHVHQSAAYQGLNLHSVLELELHKVNLEKNNYAE